MVEFIRDLFDFMFSERCETPVFRKVLPEEIMQEIGSSQTQTRNPFAVTNLLHFYDGDDLGLDIC